MQSIAESVGKSAFAAFESSQSAQIESILTVLLNEISALQFKIVLVLDDYHLIDSEQIDDALLFLLEHLPPQMHLVIATRENPQLPLGRLRARGHLTELRDTDLRFTPKEAATFLHQAIGLDLTADEMAALESRTEGWIAGLQLAALSMQGREDIPVFIRAFSGDNRYIVDYLAEEVLQRQPEPIRRFLLQTSILDRLHGPLCDAVTGQAEGNVRLSDLEKGNFFIVPLDDTRQWYRYHHLFADVLYAHLKADQPDQIDSLHRRASIWYERNGSADDAIRHALAAKDFTRAAVLIELACPTMAKLRQEATMLRWLKALPDELVRLRPVLSVVYAGALLTLGKSDGVEEWLRDAESGLESTADLHARPDVHSASAEKVFVDEAEYRRLPGTIAMYRSALALMTGNIIDAMKYARLVLSLMPKDAYLKRGAASALLGLTSWTSGSLDEAYRLFADGMADVQQGGYISDAIGGTNALADIRIVQGRLHQALSLYERGLQLSIEHGNPVMRGTADMFVGMGEIHRERNDLQNAMQLLLKSEEQGEHTGFPQYRYRWHVAMARVCEAQGDLQSALDLLDDAERFYVGDLFPNVRPVAAMKTKVLIAQGKLHEALEWARAHGLTASDELSYLREFEHITLARLLLARFQSEREYSFLHEAMGLLDRLRQAAKEGERTGSAIEIMIVTALAHQMKGDTPAALGPLERALTLAEPEGYFRIFVDEGQPMEVLLGAASKKGLNPKEFVRRLLAAFGRTKPVANHSLREPLSERERDVLRLLRTELSGPDIARELIVSLNTLRTHTKNIYDKLGVNNRRAAVRRSEELDLI
ncbi:LuxR C-terminal-related transcriptional regulator [Paenibacillus sp. MMO-58]|uniref:LuxR C-terminal-related transcriptional regulator n=1 Tax=Paenibacillus sp. MMO-58 TaxID=3081290 RepID=UPI003019F955